MSNDYPGHLNETQPYMASDGGMEKPKSNWFRGCLIGCLVVGVICTIVCAGVGYYVYKNGPRLAIQATRQVVTTILIETDLPDEEQAAILEQFDRVGDAYLAGDLPLQDVILIMQDFVESPLMSMLLIQAVNAGHLEQSGLSEEEKAEARDTIQRIFTGIMNDQLEQSDLEPLMRHIRQFPDSTDPGQRQQIKNSFTDEELRTLIAEAKQLCDDKDIPLEDTEVKISEKMKEIIDQRLLQ